MKFMQHQNLVDKFRRPCPFEEQGISSSQLWLIWENTPSYPRDGGFPQMLRFFIHSQNCVHKKMHPFLLVRLFFWMKAVI